MCSIFGVRTLESVDGLRERLERMAVVLNHRGPDDRGFHIEHNAVAESIGLGMNRLSIVDRAGGRQPIFSADESLVIVFNGEVYNYPELREQLEQKNHRFKTNSDTEVVLHVYQEFGAEGVQMLNGIFAFAILDRTRGELFLARDRFGVKPLVYSHGSEFVFASETRGLLSAGGIGTELDQQTVSDYFSLGYVPPNRSIYKNVKKLPAAHYLRLDSSGNLETTRYWQPSYQEVSISQEEATEEFLSKLRTAVHRQLMGEVPVGLFLSGGLDSSAIGALLAEDGCIPYKTFSVGFDEPDHDETPIVERYLEQYKCEHSVVRMSGNDVLPLVEKVTTALNEPLGFTAYPYYMLCKRARQDITVALAGDGGDELLGGYDTYYGHSLLQVYRKFPKFLRKSIFSALLKVTPTSYGKRGLELKLRKFQEAGEHTPERGHVSWREILSVSEKQQLLSLSSDVDLDPYYVFRESIENQSISHIVNRFMYCDQETFLQEACLSIADRLGMAHSLEVRVPFLDNDFYDFASSLPMSLKTRGMTTKRIARLALQGKLSREHIAAPKLGFAPPFGKWILGPLRTYFEDLLHSQKLRDLGFINQDLAIEYLDEHLAGKKIIRGS